MRMRKRKRHKKINEKSTWFSEVRFYIESIAFLVIEMGFWSLYVAFNYRIDCNNLRIRMAFQTYVYKITGRECRRAGWLIILSSLFRIKLCIFNVFLYSACSSTFITNFIYWRWLFTVLSFVKRKQTVLLLPLWSVTLLSVFYSLSPTHEREREKPSAYKIFQQTAKKHTIEWERSIFRKRSIFRE